MQYKRYSLALTDQEDKELEEVKLKHGYGVKQIFMAMVRSLRATPSTELKVAHVDPKPVAHVEEEI